MHQPTPRAHRPERLSLLLGAAVLFAGLARAQQYVMVPDTQIDRVMLFDAFDGSPVLLDFIVDAGGSPYNFIVPREAIQVDDEIWVFDSNSDQIVRFDLGGNHIATIPPAVGMVDAMGGGAFANGTVYVSSDGSGNGATPETVVYFDTSGNRMGQFDVSNSGTRPTDVVEFKGELLVSHLTSANNMGRYDYFGNLLGIFHSPTGVTGIDHAGQLNPTSADTVLAAGLGNPVGIYEYDASGTQINYWAAGSGNVGVFELGNGSILFTSGAVYALDRASGATTMVLAGVSGQYISPLTLPELSKFCTSKPSSLPGCTPTLDGPGILLSKSAGPGSFDITAGPAPGGTSNLGILIYTKAGLLASPSSTLFGELCLDQFLRAAIPETPGGTGGVCDGSYLWDFGAFAAFASLIDVGDTLHVQAWYRDPTNPGTANFTEAIGPIYVKP